MTLKFDALKRLRIGFETFLFSTNSQAEQLAEAWGEISLIYWKNLPENLQKEFNEVKEAIYEKIEEGQNVSSIHPGAVKKLKIKLWDFYQSCINEAQEVSNPEVIKSAQPD